MNSRGCIAAVAMVLAGTQGQVTVFMNGNDLVENMRQFEQSERNAPYKEFGAGYYMGYVTAVADAYSGTLWCPGTDRVIISQIAETVAKFINNNPELRHFAARDLVKLALEQAFPCKK